MHYDYFDFEHTMDDEARVAFLQQHYERILTTASEGSGRKIGRLLKFLQTSDFYRIPCRHHNFVGGNAWHQLETWLYAHSDEQPDMETSFCSNESFRQWQPQWLAGDPFGIAIVSLLHDVCNVQGVTYPPRIMKRHGRKSTYVLTDFLKFDLMFDENMAIIHHQHKDHDTLLDKTPTAEDCERIWEMPLYRMIQHCDTLSCIARMTEAELQKRLEQTGV